jgi:thiosulfate oxidation carrier complex protein SoxZ
MMKRRDFIGLSFVSILFSPLNALAALWNAAAFQAETTAEAEQRLSVTNEVASEAIEIIAPSHAENGAIVQLAVQSHIPNTEAIAVFVDNNPTALIGNYMFYQQAVPWMVTRIKMAETSDIKIIVKSGNQYFTATKQVKVLENGCGGSSNSHAQFKSSMKIRAKQLTDSGVTQIKAIITHPMHTGYGKDDMGKLIPAHFIQLVTIKHNNQPVIEMQLGTGIAKNPYLTCHLNQAVLGDTITVEWEDNLGYAGQSETKVTV